jgi:deoxyribonuclease-4
MMKDDMARMELIPGNYYNFHPGSHTGQGVEVGIGFIVEALNEVLPLAEHTTVLLETMAGKGSEIGRSFEELQAIILGVDEKHRERLGICMDTCHLHDAGYDIINDLDGVLNEFDKVVGLNRLKACHLNDSMNLAGSRKDRHAKIGEGHIGLEALVGVVTHPALRHLPFILETPNELPGYAAEISLLRSEFHRRMV